MKKRFIFFCFVYFIPFFISAYEINIDYVKNFGGNNSDYFYSVLSLNDGGFIAVGRSLSEDIDGITSNGDSDAVIVKFDSLGNVVWKKNWGGSAYDYFYSISMSNDGCFILTGGSWSTDITGIVNNGSKDAIILKYDKDGNLLWQKSFGGSGDDDFDSIISLKDGGFVTVGRFASANITDLLNMGSDDGVVVKYDKDGNIIWQKSFGGSGSDKFNSVLVNNDEEIIVCGQSNSIDLFNITNMGSNDGIVVKYDKDGNLLWNKNWGGNQDDIFNSISLASDGNFIVVGQFASTDTSISNKGMDDAIILKYSYDGNIIWQKSFGGSNKDIFNSVVIAKDDSAIVVGGVKSKDIVQINNIGGEDLVLLRYDKYGNPIMIKNWGGNKTDSIKSIDIGVNGEVVLAGYSNSTVIEGISNSGIDGVVLKYLLKYNLNIKDNIVNGNVSAIQKGNSGIITLVPNDGFEVKSVIVKDTNDYDVDVTKLENETFSFELYDDVSIDVSFVRSFTIDKKEITNGKVDIVKLDNNIARVTPIPNEGYEFDKIVIKDKTGNVLDLDVTKLEDGTYSFSLYTDVSVEVTFKEKVDNPKTGLLDYGAILSLFMLLPILALVYICRYNQKYGL